ncbi:hypothetical protein [uncultured Nostoc sp.]|uniref:hypothetical protein n=1 Tax=uncultured Nostoc sp. TaxID=340711 RepID=UPI002612437D|nr:hypothetical protein [uncultured Nostoc sp.]
MSVAQFTDFVKNITTENNNPASDSSGVGAELQKALTNLQGSPEEKIAKVAQELSKVAKSKGFDVSEADVSTYIESLKVQYEINPTIASLADTYCSTSCHFGSAVNAS